MAGLSDTLSKLMQDHRHFDQLLKSLPTSPGLGSSSAGTSRLTEIARFGSNPGNLSMRVHVPQNLRSGSPLVVALHGCTQTAAAYDYGSGWSALAENHGFAVLLPQQEPSNNANCCFNWFSVADTRRDHGEAASIHQMIERTIRDHGIDRCRVYIVGLSAGGAMTSAMLAAYPDVFAGGAIIAGLPHGSATSVQDAFQAMAHAPSRSPAAWGSLVRSASNHRGPWPKLSIWHGSADPIVNPKNAECLLQQWTNVHGLSVEPDVVMQQGKHSRKIWRNRDGDDVIEAYTIAGMGHGVPLAPSLDGGHVGAFHFDVGLSSSLSIVKFWGIEAAHADVFEDNTHAEGIQPLPRRPASSADAMISSTSSIELISVPLEKPSDSERLKSDKKTVDPREIITEALKKAGLLVSPGNTSASDPRSIITATLRSVGLLKD